MKHKVMVIEDNEQNLYLITFLLEHNGYEVIQARDGSTAIQIAMKTNPDLILLDIQLPETDGYAVARRFRSESEFADVPIVAVTSYAMVGDREKCIEAGCTGYIEKPIDPDTFIPELEKYLLISRKDIDKKDTDRL
ncbi:MAG: response regulator [Syntrophobacteraceae bacterium]|jgi:two-component system cell cycle response regulator DivK